ncbi:unnamed protein product [Macrosiphum euphorbiae]|uniref:Chromo domain-containing protein n=1 Tax=Macrosiphum euphorbiae TaxID=13131 RepID=A0AAV0YA52_9HEMI|nr:unnamed protein product [Macrosiphum euphorbiae]
MASSVRKAERIMGATNAGGELYYFMKWEDIESIEVVSAKEVDIMYPQIVKNFYQEKVLSDQKSTMNKNYEEIMAVYNCGGKLTYLMKFEGMDVVECVPAQAANLMCPQIVIKFYEERISHGPVQINSGDENDE